MPVDSQMQEDYSSQITQNYSNDRKSEMHSVSEPDDSQRESENFSHFKDNFIMADVKVQTSSNVNGNNEKVLAGCLASVRPKIISESNTTQHMYVQPFKPNKWSRMIGFSMSGNELRSSLFSRKLKSTSLRFAQAKKSLNHVYSYFSVKILECDKSSNVIIGLSRRDFPRTAEIGSTLGSVAYSGGSGELIGRNENIVTVEKFSKGDLVGCGILYPPHYRRYADLSTDDSSDGMTDVVLSSLLNVNKKSMDFVQSVLRLKRTKSDSSSSEEDILTDVDQKPNSDYYNENYVESRSQVEVYFTLNMQIVGKVSTCIPIGGFYPTVQVSSFGEARLQFEFS